MNCKNLENLLDIDLISHKIIRYSKVFEEDTLTNIGNIISITVESFMSINDKNINFDFSVDIKHGLICKVFTFYSSIHGFSFSISFAVIDSWFLKDANKTLRKLLTSKNINEIKLGLNLCQ